MDQAGKFKETFFQECEELLGKLERDLHDLAAGTGRSEHVQSAFRAIHSIKGGAGMFGFSRLVAFSHVYESALETLLKGRAAINAPLVHRLLTASDILADLVHSARSGEYLAQGFESESADMLSSLAKGCAVPVRPTSTATAAAQSPGSGDRKAAPHAAPDGKTIYCITLTPLAGMFRRAIEPLSIIRALKELGTLDVTADTSALPDFPAMEAVAPYFSWTMRLATSAPESVVRTVFDFAAGSCHFTIAVDGGAPGAMQITTGLTGEPAAVQAPLTGQLANLGSVPSPDEHATLVSAEDSAWNRAALPFDGDRRISSIRVDLDRVDRLVNLVGEIAIAQAMVLQQVDQSLIDANPHLASVLNQLVQHTRGLQDSVMAIRAQPVRSIFGRIPRVVREVSALLGKKVTLATAGEDTEIDKTIIEALSDPLLHLIRNCIDHGIETPEERVQAGKPVHGTICLSAVQQGSRIIIQVTDDGRGINREALRRKAIERGVISRDDTLSDNEIDALVFTPGLSTADAVSDISGRGIGMDIVMSSVLKIGGRVTISSIPGHGTATQLTLPLTLAVLDGMVIRADRESYVIPLSNVRECMLVPAHNIHHIPGTGHTVNLRGRQTPLISLQGTLESAPRVLGSMTQVLIAEAENGHIAALAVDEIVGQQQVVVKSVREHYADVAGIAGATILGDGRVALILDTAEVLALKSAAASISGFNEFCRTDAGAQAA